MTDSSDCIACGVSLYQTGSGMGLPEDCTLCAAGKYLTGVGQMEDTCIPSTCPCGLGFHCTVGGSCQVGFRNTADGSCQEVPPSCREPAPPCDPGIQCEWTDPVRGVLVSRTCPVASRALGPVRWRPGLSDLFGGVPVSRVRSRPGLSDLSGCVPVLFGGSPVSLS